MRERSKRWIVVVGSLALVAVLSGCGAGLTRNADQITVSSMRLNGEVSNTVVGTTTWYFEYGLTPSYGSTTPVETLDATEADHGYPVSATVTGLAEATDYFFRLCAFDADGKGACGANQRDRTLQTVTWDAVDGTGYVLDDPIGGVQIGGSLAAREAYDPEYGYGSAYTVLGPPAPAHYGDATCLAVAGNRAAMGFESWADGSQKFLVVFVEDNGSTGDRWGQIVVAERPTTCPAPAAYDFPSFVLGSTVIPAVVTSGDFVVHDEP